jgi:hypothetical protein
VLLLEGGVLERVGEDVEGRQEGRKEGRKEERKRERGERRKVESMFASSAVYPCLVRRHVFTVAHLSTVLHLQLKIIRNSYKGERSEVRC